jgi:hypothetical protein
MNDGTARRERRQGMKVHLTEVPMGRLTYRIVTLRDACDVRYSTNFFHGTWHILTDGPGAAVLADLLWGLSFQKREDTLVVIHGKHLVTTPFEGDPADPIVLAPSGAQGLGADGLRALRRRLPRLRDGTTIRWHAFGLDETAAAGAPLRPFWNDERSRPRDRMDRVGGVVCYTAARGTMREEAQVLHRMRRGWGMEYHYLAHSPRDARHPQGEVQVFRGFRDLVATARVARRVVLGTGTRIEGADQREAIHDERERVGRRLHGARLRGTEQR